MPESDHLVYLNNYTPAADIAVIAVCYVMLILLLFSYNRKTKSYRVFLSIIPCLIVASSASVSYQLMLATGRLSTTVYFFRCLYHAGLFAIFFLFTLYMTIVTRLESRTKHWINGLAGLLLAVLIGADVGTSFFGNALVVTDQGIVSNESFIFIVGYFLFAVTDVVMLAMVRRRLYRQVMFGFYGTVALSFLVLMAQRFFNQSSFTSLSFLFPVIGMFYIMHSSPYNAKLGAVGSDALHDTVRYNYERQRRFIYISLYLPAFGGEDSKLPESVQDLVRHYSATVFRGSLLFQVGKGFLILLFPLHRNPDYEHRMNKILNAFREHQKELKYDYKIVIGESAEEISRKNEYVSLIRNVLRIMKINTIHRVSPEDLKAFNYSEYILSELEDIYTKHDLNDSRVLVYCQPVFNIKTGKYDTAEALMRLRLEKTDLVFPDQFIYLAESHGLIHVLTEIILHKTCEELSRLLQAGYEITRISVNVSMHELKDEHFCDDIHSIVDQSGISGDKIAIELTESQNESDFELMKSKIEELKDQGIKFYLDDFGTGYSNMERIMELPFDIIKFDRSLVLACGNSERSGKMVGNLASLFTNMNYSVLYEGVETESDENMCREMCASYLQGYKYSRPIPIEKLKQFVSKAS